MEQQEFSSLTWDYKMVTASLEDSLVILHKVKLRLTMCECVCVSVCVLISQWCLTLCDPMDYSLRGSYLRGILQEGIWEWVAIPFSREPSQRLNHGSCIAGIFFIIWATKEAPLPSNCSPRYYPTDLKIYVITKTCMQMCIVTKQ